MRIMKMSKERTRFHRSFDEEMKRRFGGKVWRLSLSSGCTCPNRDGKAGTGGCIFCSEGGSGEFAAAFRKEDAFGPGGIRAQLEEAKKKVARKRSAGFAGYMAYFQSFTNTYGDPEELEKMFLAAASDPEVLALSIATRPDCLGPEIMDMLIRLNRRIPVTVELGLQTSDDVTAKYLNRGYPLSVFEDAFHRLKAADLETVVHIIAGLPGEDCERSLETVRYLSGFTHEGAHIDGIKIQLLQVLKGTRLAALHESQTQRYPEGVSPSDILQGQSAAGTGNVGVLPLWDPELLRREMLIPEYTLESYTALIGRMLEILPEDIVIHRITGDPPKKLLIAPFWTADKKRVLNYMKRELGTSECMKEPGNPRGMRREQFENTAGLRL